VDIRSNPNSSLDGSNLNGLTSILGVSESSAPSSTSLYGQSANAGEFAGFDGDWATLSTAGSSMAQAASDAGVRDDKVASIRTALAAGTYAIPAQAVAQRAMSAMLGQGA
jgi:flagellar biosynthesis anti-sigma factor FlgM